MTTSEYLLNAAFVLLVLRQAKERELDRRSVIVPLLLMFLSVPNTCTPFPPPETTSSWSSPSPPSG